MLPSIPVREWSQLSETQTKPLGKEQLPKLTRIFALDEPAMNEQKLHSAVRKPHVVDGRNFQQETQ